MGGAGVGGEGGAAGSAHCVPRSSQPAQQHFKTTDRVWTPPQEKVDI